MIVPNLLLASEDIKQKERTNERSCVKRLIETNFAQATASRPSIAAGTSQSTNVHLTQGQSILKFPLMGMVYTLTVSEDFKHK